MTHPLLSFGSLSKLFPKNFPYAGEEVEYDSSCFQLKTKLQAFTTQVQSSQLNAIYGQCYAMFLRNYDMQSRHVEAMQGRETAVRLISMEATSLFDILTIV